MKTLNRMLLATCAAILGAAPSVCGAAEWVAVAQSDEMTAYLDVSSVVPLKGVGIKAWTRADHKIPTTDTPAPFPVRQIVSLVWLNCSERTMGWVQATMYESGEGARRNYSINHPNPRNSLKDVTPDTTGELIFSESCKVFAQRYGGSGKRQ